MQWSFTSDGIAAMSRSVADGEALVFTRVIMGTGTSDGTAVAEPLPALPDGVPVTEVTAAGENRIEVKCNINNSGFTTDATVTEIGIYIQDPDDATTEHLFVYGSGTFRYIPSAVSPYEGPEVFGITLTQGASATVEIDESLVYVTKKQFDDYSAEKAAEIRTLTGLITGLRTDLTAAVARIAAAERRIEILADWGTVTFTATYTPNEDCEDVMLEPIGTLTISNATGTWSDGTSMSFSEAKSTPIYDSATGPGEPYCYAVATISESKVVTLTPDQTGREHSENNYTAINPTETSTYTTKIYTR